MLREVVGVFLVAVLCFVAAEVVVLSSITTLHDMSPKLRVKTSGIDSSQADVVIVLGATGQKALVADVDYTLTTTDLNDGFVLKLLPGRKWADTTDRTPPVALILSSVKFGEGPELLAEKAVVANIISGPRVDVAAEVVILSSTNMLYDMSPKLLRVKTSGIDSSEADVVIVLGATGQKALVADVDYTLTTTDLNDGFVLKLLPGRKWADTTDRTPPVALILSSVKFGEGPELLAEKAVVANILSTPRVVENRSLVLRPTATELSVNVVGIDGAKYVELYFEPPVSSHAYKTVSYSRNANNEEIVLLAIVVSGYFWRTSGGYVDTTPGNVYVKGIDTGAGLIKVGGDSGVLVAVVSNNLPGQAVTVDDTSDEQHIYHDESYVSVIGSGFKDGNQQSSVQFSNGFNQFGAIKIKETHMTLWKPTKEHFWRADIENLPGYLTVISFYVDNGLSGTVGPVNSTRGQNIATVFERPFVAPLNTKLYRTQSRELHIYGGGFTTKFSRPRIRFNPVLVGGVDYTLRVERRDDLEITLKDGKSWGAVGSLRIEAYNARGDEAGWVVFPDGGVKVADIVEDRLLTSPTTCAHSNTSKLEYCNMHC